MAFPLIQWFVSQSSLLCLRGLLVPTMSGWQRLLNPMSQPSVFSFQRLIDLCYRHHQRKGWRTHSLFVTLRNLTLWTRTTMLWSGRHQKGHSHAEACRMLQESDTKRGSVQWLWMDLQHQNLFWLHSIHLAFSVVCGRGIQFHCMESLSSQMNHISQSTDGHDAQVASCKLLSQPHAHNHFLSFLVNALLRHSRRFSSYQSFA